MTPDSNIPAGWVLVPVPTDTQEYVLRAMARNYGDGPHSWDHLDKTACIKAADEIKQLRAMLNAAPKATEPAATMFRGKPHDRTPSL